MPSNTAPGTDTEGAEDFVTPFQGAIQNIDWLPGVARRGRAYPWLFSLALSGQQLLITNDHSFDRRRQLVHLAAREAGVLKHLLEFSKCVSVAAGRAAEHLH